MSDAFIGQIFLERRDGTASPATFERICQVFDISGIGEQNSEEDVTTFCSGGNREYISGLAEGTQPTIQCLYERANTLIRKLIQDVKDKTNVEYRLVVEEEETPVEYFYLTLAPLSWELGPSFEGKNTINFGYRVSGPVEIEDAV